jgi:hypothetical protein
MQPAGYWLDFQAYSDSRKALVFSFYGEVSHRDDGSDLDFAIGPELRWKPGSNVSFSLHPEVEFLDTSRQWVVNVDDPLMTATFGRRHVFATLEQNIISAEMRLNWIFTPKISLQVYLQPMIAVGRYSDFKELALPASREFVRFGSGPSTIERGDTDYRVDPDGAGPAAAFTFRDPDFNFKSLRGTLIFRWEYHPGSAFFVVWTQNRRDFANPGDLDFGRDVGDMLSAEGDNVFMIKASHRFNF